MRKTLLTIVMAAALPALAASPLEEAAGMVGQYRLDEASELLDNWETKANKSKKTRLTNEQNEALDALRARIITMRNMLDRVEQIEVIDSLTVDAEAFFLNYRLSPEAGRLTLGTGRESDYAEVAFTPECGREIIWAAPGDDGVSRLMGASILDDGTIEGEGELDPGLGQGENASYPFLMADGISLYYASDGEGSIGGYDIFLTRRNDEGGYTVPQNVGMPYNSPYNDYMLAIDEASGLGWWATDRNAPDGKVNIYVFVPSDVRVNYPADREDIASLALLTDIKATQTSVRDYSERLAKVHSPRQTEGEQARGGNLFTLSAGGRLYTNLSDFRSSDARHAMTNVIALQREQADIDDRLSALQARYASGARDLAGEIRSLEHRRSSLSAEVKRARNQVVKYETGIK